MYEAAAPPSFLLLITPHLLFFLCCSNLCARRDVTWLCTQRSHPVHPLHLVMNFILILFFVNLCNVFLRLNPVFVRSGMNQPADGGFGGPGTPQSPLLSPRMAHAQSPMMQQGQGGAAFQGSPEMNGWTQGGMGGNR